LTICGDVLTKSLKARLSVGSRRSAESEISDWAPVRAVDKSGFDSVSTVTASSCTADRFRLRSSTKRWPSCRLNGVPVLGSKPRARTVSV